MTIDGLVAVPEGVTTSTKVRVAAVTVVANVLGAGILTGLAGWVLPLRALVIDQEAALRQHLLLFFSYAPAAALGAIVWGWLWLRVPVAPGVEASPARRAAFAQRVQAVVLRAPVRLALVQAVPWAVGLVLFAAVDTAYGPALVVAVAELIALGGIATVTVAYQCCDLVLRREVARVVVFEPPTDRKVAGVAWRSVGAWAFGTGVPLVGLGLTGATAVGFAGYYTPSRLGVVVLVLALGGFAVGLLVTVLSSASTASSVQAVARAMRRVRDGDLTAIVPVTDTTELGLLQAGFNTMVTGLRERERLRELFGRQVGEDVARAAEDGDLELGGEVRDVAVLFVDLVGSTTLAATRPPTEVVALLNRFFAEVVDVVGAGGGWINKFEGDAALAIFGAPVGQDDPAGRALRTARTLAERLRLAEVELRAGIGVSAGEVVAGNIGGERRYEYTVIGDPVNEAARLCSVAKDHDHGVAASGAALERAHDDETACWRVVGAQRLRGRPADTVIAVPLCDRVS